MYYPSNNWYVFRQNFFGVWQVEAQHGCFYVPCPSRFKANQVRDFLMTWLRNSHFYRLHAVCKFVHLLIDNKITFDEFYKQVKVIHFSDEQEF